MDFIKSLVEFAKSEQTVHDISTLVKNAKSANETRRNTEGFALENDDGSIVKVFVKAEQAEEFQNALARALYDAEEDGTEVPEVLFNLRKNFEIVDVEWGPKSIPEDEETDMSLEQPKDKKSSSDDLEGLDDLESDDDSSEGDDSADEISELGMDDAMAGSDDVAASGSNEQDIMSALAQVLDMLKADAEAKTAEAEARKAEAEVKIASEANKSAKMRAAQEEEVLDMEDHNKRKDEEKKMSDTRDKLIKYRHELKNSTDKDLGESMNMDPNKKKYPDATQEEEEFLDAQEWDKKEKERQKLKRERELVKKFRHKKKKGEVKDAVSGMKAESIEKIRSITFSKFNVLIEQQLAQQPK